MEIKFRYFSNNEWKDPPMSDALRVLIKACLEFTQCDEAQIVHVGTVGDLRHKEENPKSYHNHIPPDAIDVQRIDLLWSDPSEERSGLRTTIEGKEYAVLVLNLQHSLEDRALVAGVWTRFGGKTYHATNPGYGHLHLQTGG